MAREPARIAETRLSFDMGNLLMVLRETLRATPGDVVRGL